MELAPSKSVEKSEVRFDVRSLEDVHRSVALPTSFWRRLFAFAGPAYMVSVGYMDPGNWATDIEGGARFGYRLIWVLLMSNLMAVLLQTLSARLGVVTGRDLAQACRDSYGGVSRYVLFGLCEIAIAACDLAEVLGTAIGLNLLTAQLGLFGGQGIPLVWAVVLTGLDVFLLLLVQRAGIRRMEAMIFFLVIIVGGCFIVELFLAKPSPVGIAKGFIPGMLGGDMLIVAIGILGATVMPHNLYLHSALVQSRRVLRTKEGLQEANWYNLIDSAIALNAAFFVNAAILILAAAAFYSRGIEVSEIQQAHHLLEGLLGSRIAPYAFAIALICAGQSSTITGTLAGQVTMEGFLHIRIRPWLRRLITRSLAIIPAVIVISIAGDAGTFKLLILSQVILSLQLPFAIVPLVKFTSSKAKMGSFASGPMVTIAAWLVATIIILLNAKLVYEQIGEWSASAGEYGWLVLATAVPAALGLGTMLLWMTVKRESVHGEPIASAPEHDRGFDVLVPELPNAHAAMVELVRGAVARTPRRYARVGVALGADGNDAPMLAEAISVAKHHGATVVLMHVVEGVGGQYQGAQADDAERREDEVYVTELAARLQADLAEQVRGVEFRLGYGGVKGELIRMAHEAGIDLIVVGGHGHRGLSDILRGTTIDAVRHGLAIPLLAVRN